jgi:hypothetical protein
VSTPHPGKRHRVAAATRRSRDGEYSIGDMQCEATPTIGPPFLRELLMGSRDKIPTRRSRQIAWERCFDIDGRHGRKLKGQGIKGQCETVRLSAIVCVGPARSTWPADVVACIQRATPSPCIGPRDSVLSRRHAGLPCNSVTGGSALTHSRPRSMEGVNASLEHQTGARAHVASGHERARKARATPQPRSLPSRSISGTAPRGQSGGRHTKARPRQLPVRPRMTIPPDGVCAESPKRATA